MLVVELNEQMLKVAQRYVDRKITRARAAALLRLSERQVTRICTELGLERVKSPRAQEEEQSAARKTAKLQAAQAVIDGRITVAQAAKRAGVHERTIARHIERLKTKPKPKKKRAK